MIYAALVFFILAACLGLYLFSYVVQKKETPKAIAFIHGPLAATGLVLLILYFCWYNPKPVAALIVFLLAALGGLVLILRDIMGKSLPWWMALGHGLVGAAGIALLIVFALQNP